MSRAIERIQFARPGQVIGALTLPHEPGGGKALLSVWSG